MATAALVLGIISVAISVLGGFASLGWIGSICGILAIIFGVLGQKGPEADAKKAKIGMILGIIALAWGIVVTIACLACIGAASSAALNYLQ